MFLFSKYSQTDFHGLITVYKYLHFNGFYGNNLLKVVSRFRVDPPDEHGTWRHAGGSLSVSAQRGVEGVIEENAEFLDFMDPAGVIQTRCRV